LDNYGTIAGYSRAVAHAYCINFSLIYTLLQDWNFLRAKVAAKRNKKVGRFYSWFAKYHWMGIGTLAVLLIFLEFYELQEVQSSPIHGIELVIYVLFLIIVGIMNDLLVAAVSAQNRSMNILDQKHKLSLALTNYEEWNVLTDQVVKFPSTIVPVNEACLFLINSISRQRELAACWTGGAGETGACKDTCQNCVKMSSDEVLSFTPCLENVGNENGAQPMQSFCLPIHHAEKVIALLKFQLKPGERLTEEQMDIFENIGTEVAIALKAGQDIKILSEMQASQAALAERRSFSHYLHDHLSQNLAYLLLKIEQMIGKQEDISEADRNPDLDHMREAAKESYEIVRKKIETIRPETSNRLINLLSEHSKKVSDRSDINVTINESGTPSLLSPEIQRALFYVFQEALSNVEKHARAKDVDVLVKWNKDDLTMSISDNGIGFNPVNVDSSAHFGMEIMRERIANVNGQLHLDTSYHSGTTITIWVPLKKMVNYE
jgi:signal transduction histidine kinase